MLLEEIQSKTKQWLDKMRIKNYTINPNGTVDVKGGVNISNLQLLSIPVQFGTVDGNFYCSGNMLYNLKGAPREVGGNFQCNDNRLSDLVGSPREVGYNFLCWSNSLTSLKGAPKEVGGDFDCSDNLFKEEPDHSHIKIAREFVWE